MHGWLCAPNSHVLEVNSSVVQGVLWDLQKASQGLQPSPHRMRTWKTLVAPRACMLLPGAEAGARRLSGKAAATVEVVSNATIPEAASTEKPENYKPDPKFKEGKKAKPFVPVLEDRVTEKEGDDASSKRNVTTKYTPRKSLQPASLPETHQA